MKDFIFGIDLGTTNSVISVYCKKKAVPLNFDWGVLFPSCVLVNEDGSYIIGNNAYLAKSDPKKATRVIASAKRYMGTDKTYSFTMADGSNKILTPVDVSSLILKEMIDTCDQSYGHPHKVVITVPAYFKQEQRVATIQSAQQAGLEVVKIINEPTAGLLAYTDINSKSIEDSDILCLDVGGGTTDITLISLKSVNKVHPFLNDFIKAGSHIEILATGGNNFLGGDDLDLLLVDEIFKGNLLNNRISYEEFNSMFNGVNSFRSNILFLAETCKKEFSDTKARMYRLDYNDKSYNFTLTYEMYQNAMNVFFDKVKVCIAECLGTHLPPSHCLLVGGSTKSILFQQMLKDYYKERGVELTSDFYSNTFQDISVGQGASIQGAIISGEIDNISMKDVISIPIRVGIISTDGEYIAKPVINKDSLIPVSSNLYLTNNIENQKTCNIKLYQGFSNNIDDCSYLGMFTINDLPEAEAETLDICFAFCIDINGCLFINAYINNTLWKSVTFDSVLLPVANANSDDIDDSVYLIKELLSILPKTEQYSEYRKFCETFKSGDVFPDWYSEVLESVESNTSNSFAEEFTSMFANDEDIYSDIEGEV